MNLPLLLVSPGFVVLFRWTCLLAFGWLVHWALRRRHSRWRLILWRGILCSGLVLPLLHFFPVPGVKIPVRMSHPPSMGDRVAAAQIRPALSAATPSPHLPPADDPVSRTAKTSPNSTSPEPFDWGDILAVIWILGCAFGGFRLVRLQLRLSHLRKTSRPIPDLQRLATQIQNRLNVRGRIDITISEDVSSPFICGLFKPAIILPQTLAQNLSTEEVYSLLNHEIAHLRQHDLFWCVAWQWMKAFSWFHPLVWNIPAAHNLACEQEADRVAAGQLENADSYSQMLARLALRVLALPAVETKLTLNGSSQIALRLNYLGQTGIGAWNWKFSAAGFGIVALIFLIMAGSGFSILPASPSQEDNKHAPFMVDQRHGWNMAYMNRVAVVQRTEDGGKHWMNVSPPALAAAAQGKDADYLEESTALCPLDAQRAWMAVIVKDRVMLEFTSSGGRHWTESMGPPAMVAVNISFLDEKTGYLLNSSDTAAGHQLKEVYATYDCGQRWKQLTSPNLEGMGYYTTGITFRSPLEGWVTGTYHGEPDAPLFRTEDGGKTWNVQKLTFPRDYQGGYADIYRPVFIGVGKMRGYLPVNLVRHDPPPDRRAWVNYETDDGGITWHAPGSGPMPHVTQDYTYDVPVVLEGYVTEEPAVENLGEPWPEGEKPRKTSTIFVFVLKKPITVIGNPADPISTETETNVSHLQMIDSGPGDVAAWEARLENHVKQRDLIVINGSLLHAHTVHHKTPVLLLPTSFRPANAPDPQEKPRNTSLRTLPAVSFGKMLKACNEKLGCYFTLEYIGYSVTGTVSPVDPKRAEAFDLDDKSIDSVVQSLRVHLPDFEAAEDPGNPKIIHLIEKTLADDPAYALNRKITLNYSGTADPSAASNEDGSPKPIIKGLTAAIGEKLDGFMSGSKDWYAFPGGGEGSIANSSEVTVSAVNETVRNILTENIQPEKFSAILWRAVLEKRFTEDTKPIVLFEFMGTNF